MKLTEFKEYIRSTIKEIFEESSSSTKIKLPTRVETPTLAPSSPVRVVDKNGKLIKRFTGMSSHKLAREFSNKLNSQSPVKEIFDEPTEYPEIEPSGQAQKELKDLFSRGDIESISSETIEEIAYKFVKDADSAVKLTDQLQSEAEKFAQEFGYTADGSGGFTKKSTDTPLNENRVKKLKSIILESIEEIKIEAEKTINEEMDSLNKVVKEASSSSVSVEKSKKLKGSYEICGDFPHYFEIRPIVLNGYDVMYIKDNTDREKKFNLTFKELKEYVKEKMTSKDGNYVQKAFNKAADQAKDKTKKTEVTSGNEVKKKTVSDKKNDNKDYNEPSIKKEEDNAVKEVKDIKKQSDHPKEGDKAKYTFPKQDKKEKAHVVKGGKGKELKLPETKIKKK